MRSIFILVCGLVLSAVGVRAEELFYSRAQKQWGLAASAVLTLRNDDDFYSLTGVVDLEREATYQKGRLRRWWGVESREDLLESLEWAARVGHREEFMQIRRARAFWPGRMRGLRDWLLRKKRSRSYEERVAFVEQHADELNDDSLVGWDLARVISLARWGVACGYLEEAEAWGWIIPAAQEIQQTYDSWEELGKSYLLGRAYWSARETRRSGYRYEQAVFWLSSNEHSPWVKLDWNLDLTGSADALGDESQLPKTQWYYLGVYHARAKRYRRAQRVWDKACESGREATRGLACHKLGDIYKYGRPGVRKDLARALEFYEAGAEWNNADCLFQLGYAFYSGNGRPQDFAQAMEWWGRAAQQGHANALANLGLLYSRGQGCRQDLTKAMDYYRQASRRGSTLADNNAAWLMHEHAEFWDADEAVRLAYAGVQRWECLAHYDTLINVLIRAGRSREALAELGRWINYDRREKPSYDPLALPERFIKLRRRIVEDLSTSPAD